MNNFFKTTSKGSQLLDKRALSQELALTSYFRQLSGHEEESVTLIDNRDMKKPNNKVLILCEHATNDLKMTKVEHLEQNYMLGHDAFDPGAADLSNYLSENLSVFAVHANFSRLLIDPAKPIVSDGLVPVTYSDGELVSFNKDGYILNDRLGFYLNYQNILTEVVWWLNPDVVVAIKSHSNCESKLISTHQFDSLFPVEQMPRCDPTLEAIRQFWPERSLEAV